MCCAQPHKWCNI